MELIMGSVRRVWRLWKREGTGIAKCRGLIRVANLNLFVKYLSVKLTDVSPLQKRFRIIKLFFFIRNGAKAVS